MKKLFFILISISVIGSIQAQSDTLNRTDKFGKKYGYWKVYDNKTLVYEGRFYNGEPVGKLTHYHTNGQIKSIATYTINSPKVPTTIYHENGIKAAEGLFINKQKDGKWMYYSTNGNLISEENYKAGKKDGVFRTYAKDGVILEETNWKNDKREGLSYNNYISGDLRLKMYYKDNKMDGPFENYYENGKIWTKGNYKNDFRNGEWITYNEEGKELLTQTFEMGKITSTILGFNTGAQWIKLDVKNIAYFHQAATDIVICMKNKNRIHIIKDRLIEIAERAGVENFIFLNENTLSSYTSIKKVTPTDDTDTEAAIMLKPDPDFEVFCYGDYYKMLKSLLTPDAPRQNVDIQF